VAILSVGTVVILAAALLVLWAFSSTPIKKQHGFRNKITLLFSDGFEGPQQTGRIFGVGICGMLIGGVILIASLKPGLFFYAFCAAWLSMLAMFLVALHRKWSAPAGESRKSKKQARQR
jgi:hypothetical protein